MTDTILANARMVLPAEVVTGSLRLSGGLIAEVATGPACPPGSIDCEGDFVMAGLVELHTDNLERHLEPRPKVDWPHAAAILAHDAECASVGITTVFDALRVGSIGGIALRQVREYARPLATEILALRASGLLRIGHRLHLRAETCSESLIAELAAFGPEDGVGIVSLMDHTPGERQFRDLSKLRTYYRGRNDMTEAEFQAFVDGRRALKSRLGPAHEAASVAAAARLGAVLASHDDTTAAQVAHSAAAGIRFAEFPTTLEAAEACRSQGIAVMMGAPNLIRGGSHSGNVAARALAERDLLDIVSSDYVPSALLMAGLALGDLWGDMARGVGTVTRAPADAAGLSDRGRVESGKRADLIRVRRRSGNAALRGVWVGGLRVG